MAAPIRMVGAVGVEIETPMVAGLVAIAIASVVGLGIARPVVVPAVGMAIAPFPEPRPQTPAGDTAGGEPYRFGPADQHRRCPYDHS